ncbi:MAG: class I SAM-dependent methyltransferase [Bacteroidota bacterium]
MKIQTAERNSGQELSDNVIHHRHLIAYNEAEKLIHGTVLEIGSGEGYGIRILSPKAQKYYALDKHPTPIEDESGKVIFRQAVIPPLAGFEDNYFDFVVTFQVIEHIKNDVLFLSEINRVLKPGGKLILTTPNKTMSLTRNPWHIREYTPVQFTKLIHDCFSEADIKGVYGNEKVMAYHEENRRSIRKFTRFDIFRMQYWLPRFLLQIPYDIANRMNRNKIYNESAGLVNDVTTSDFFVKEMTASCFDYFCIATKTI